jgi:hypothetical protein
MASRSETIPSELSPTVQGEMERVIGVDVGELDGCERVGAAFPPHPLDWHLEAGAAQHADNVAVVGDEAGTEL